ncbi:hypothetical protein PFUGPA_05387 [Plasmodium falciparum Palo Alto/Uganda]|uniref:Uncharacterized protein n=1 Tax=Plasmodium falciparum (isolate Palo Alto / Uganda) TaxID=57270 RepID=W4IRM2_PLAFP|nr:hypothetical protein PFUGPA_05387 [Plasmodium falciparum Palo Alto/Uganda]
MKDIYNNNNNNINKSVIDCGNNLKRIEGKKVFERNKFGQFIKKSNSPSLKDTNIKSNNNKNMKNTNHNNEENNNNNTNNTLSNKEKIKVLIDKMKKIQNKKEVNKTLDKPMYIRNFQDEKKVSTHNNAYKLKRNGDPRNYGDIKNGDNIKNGDKYQKW